MKKILALFIVLLIITGGCCMKENPSFKEAGLEHFKNPREVELKITYHLDGIKISPSDKVYMQEFSEENVSWEMEMESREPVLLLYAGRLQNYPNQRDVENLSISPPPDITVSKDIDGNIIDFWDLSEECKKGGDITITRHVRFTAYETAFRVNPEKLGVCDPDDPVYRYYTRSQEMLELTPGVIALANEIVGKEKNSFLQARAIYNWCLSEIDYVYPPNRGIRYCLPRRTGDCGSYSLIFVSLCRAVGIPARVANGHWCCAQKKNYHVWNEFYLPGYGWLPADATDGRITRDIPGKLAGNGDAFYFFGNLDSGRFVTSKGTSIQLYPVPPWHKWGLADTNRNPIFFQTAASVYANIEIERQYTTIEIIKGLDVLW